MPSACRFGMPLCRCYCRYSFSMGITLAVRALACIKRGCAALPAWVRHKSTKRSHKKNGFSHTRLRVLKLKNLRRGCGVGLASPWLRLADLTRARGPPPFRDVHRGSGMACQFLSNTAFCGVETGLGGATSRMRSDAAFTDDTAPYSARTTPFDRPGGLCD